MTYKRELERHVCEVGFDFRLTPREDRPEPYQFTVATRDLVAQGIVREAPVQILGSPYHFVWRTDLHPQLQVEGLERKRQAVEVMMSVIHDATVSGYHAEHLLARAQLGQRVREWYGLPWRPGHQITSLDDYELDPNLGSADIDLAGWHARTGIRFVAQVKNKREWLYPSNAELWSLLGAAAQLHAFPIFIARRFAESTFSFMKSVGGFALRTSKAVYPTAARDRVPVEGGPTFLQALTTLGFRTDTDFTDVPLPRHTRLWSGSINREIQGGYSRFLDIAPQILELAYGRRLADDEAHIPDRSGIVSAFHDQLVSLRLQQAIDAREAAAADDDDDDDPER